MRARLAALGLCAAAELWTVAIAARAQDGAPAVGVEVRSRCEVARVPVEALESALAIELARWSRLAIEERCRPIVVHLEPAACGSDRGELRLLATAGEGEADARLRGEDLGGPDALRAVALTSAELVERAYARCASVPPPPSEPPPPPPAAPFVDPRPLATDADRELYFGPPPVRVERPRPAAALARVRAGAMVDVLHGGGGGFADASLSSWLAEGLLVRAELGPASLSGGEVGGVLQLGGALLVGFDLGAFALAAGGGVGIANGHPGGDLVGRAALFLRLGFEPSLFGSVLLSLAVWEGGADFGAAIARFAVPVSPTVSITWGGEMAIAYAGGRLEAGAQIWLDGDAVSASGVAIEVGGALHGAAFVPRCAFGPCEEGGANVVFGPGVYTGLVLRAGP